MKDYYEKSEKSCGAVVFTRLDGKLLYLIIKSKDGICGFPKGHIEEKETEIETARREILEETGLTVEFVDGFRMEESYSFVRSGVMIKKQVVYFLAEYKNQIPVPQETELESVCIINYDTALSIFRFESTKGILCAADSFLKNNLFIKPEVL